MRFQPGEGPSRGLLRDCTTGCGTDGSFYSTNKDTMDALRELSTFFKENNLQTRRNLRGEIERRNLTITHDFLAAFRSVKETLDTVDQNVRGMSRSCASMQVGD